MVILNLPRSIRFKRENVLLLGVIPGPSEPSLNINTYLEPIVGELKKLWSGVTLKISSEAGTSSSAVFRCALIGVSCDLPAARKVCGFMGHGANLGCSRCLEPFFVTFGHNDYSNFNRSSWKMRENSQHRDNVKKVRRAKSKTARSKLESQLGCRYSILLELPYFEPVRMLLVDPMHNLFLGTAKHFTLKILIGHGILTTAKLSVIEQRLAKVRIPVGLGRLPKKIDQGVFLTAEQWKNWTVHFSVYCLHDLISREQLQCWVHFVLACRRLCKFHITQDDLRIADALLLRFCTKVSSIFGKSVLTPNMHMHCHLKSCVEEFGPFHSFWLFPFERYNGLLGKHPNNNRSIEVQLMRRFQEDNVNIAMLGHVESWPFSDTNFFLNRILLTMYATKSR